jgi:Spy/CpxP family protein refolding chaperone
MIVATILAAGLAGWLGVQYGVRQNQPPDLDTILHRKLALSSEQDRKLDALETGFAVKRGRYEREMGAANNDLARAMAQDHTVGPAAKRAIERFHTAMMGLQEETVKHVLAMRKVLTAEQAKKFDLIIYANLVGNNS